ncbi:MAG: uracil phosphoribosyltransferase, partial [Saprospiraceae bacterium]|nr:uracil phosphoribosyltransferase [Saprospiraceae bacterium]
MPFTLADNNSIANRFIAELRSTAVQNDRMRFRKNIERIGQIFAYEISKTFHYREEDIETPLGIANVPLPNDR